MCHVEIEIKFFSRGENVGLGSEIAANDGEESGENDASDPAPSMQSSVFSKDEETEGDKPDVVMSGSIVHETGCFPTEIASSAEKHFSKEKVGDHIEIPEEMLQSDGHQCASDEKRTPKKDAQGTEQE